MAFKETKRALAKVIKYCEEDPLVFSDAASLYNNISWGARDRVYNVWSLSTKLSLTAAYNDHYGILRPVSQIRVMSVKKPYGVFYGIGDESFKTGKYDTTWELSELGGKRAKKFDIKVNRFMRHAKRVSEFYIGVKQLDYEPYKKLEETLEKNKI